METQPVAVYEKTIGETAYEKIKKLILNEAESSQNAKVS